MSSEKVIKGVKAFGPDMKCRGFQFEEGKEYVHKGNVKACESGFHFCENPLDTFTYYSPSDSNFHEVEGSGEISTHEEDSKIASSILKVKGKISLKKLTEMSVEFILSKVDFKTAKESNTGYQSAATNTGTRSAATNTGTRSAATNTGTRSAATNTGDQSAATNTGTRSAATNTGYQSAATNTGYQSAATNTGTRSAATNTGTRSAATNTGTRSAATVEGESSVAFNMGYNGKAKAKEGGWIVICDHEPNGDIKEVYRAKVGSHKILGKKIQPDTFYWIENGELKSSL